MLASYEPAWLLFASDAAILALWGAGCLVLATAALMMERRRHRRDRLGAPDRVGWVPWTFVFLVMAITGAGLLAVAIPPLVGG